MSVILGISVDRGNDYERVSFTPVDLAQVCRAFCRYASLRGENDAERAAFAFFAHNVELGLMAHGNVFDDCKTETRTARLARTAAIHAIEPLGQARDVLRGNSDSAVFYAKYHMPVGLLEPA